MTQYERIVAIPRPGSSPRPNTIQHTDRRPASYADPGGESRFVQTAGFIQHALPCQLSHGTQTRRGFPSQ